MRRVRWVVLATVFSLLASLPGAAVEDDSAPDPVNQTADGSVSVVQYGGGSRERSGVSFEDRRDAYQLQIKSVIRNFSRQMTRLTARVRNHGVRRPLAFEEARLDYLEKERVVREKLDRMSSSSLQRARQLKPETDAAVRDLESAYTRAVGLVD